MLAQDNEQKITEWLYTQDDKGLMRDRWWWLVVMEINKGFYGNLQGSNGNKGNRN